MTTLTDMASTVSVAAKAVGAPMPMSAQHELELDRLAGNLLSSLTGVRPFCLLLMELGEGKNSSLWLTTGVASVFGDRLNGTVHVLSLQDAGSTKRPSPSAVRSATADNYVLESIAAHGRGGSETLAARLGSLRQACQPVLLHLPNERGLADLLPHADAIDGVVLLVRASRTRKASLQDIERQLTRAGMKCFGCVLLDRIHPIPEKLYRLL